MTQNDKDNPLRQFLPPIREWFTGRVGTPTPSQAAAWPVVKSGAHALISAPTGSGKTLSAFLYAIEQLASGQWQTGTTRVVYISPLKALNNDVRKNLLRPLSELPAYFEAAGMAMPEVRVFTRSGDTLPAERRRMEKKPPEILITTPESLSILLLSQRWRENLKGVKTVILDEIHALAGNKRGALLTAAVERLCLCAGEFQRVALSATVEPMEAAAEFAGGYAYGPDGSLIPRPVELVRTQDPRVLDCRVVFPAHDRAVTAESGWWPGMTADWKREIEKNRSTLIFTNNRRTAEKAARLLNENEKTPLAYAHHGSIAREMRLSIEDRLKRGQLRAIVATGTLELGIDVGELDSVILAGTPRSFSSAIQRIGRAGHGVGQTSKGLIYPMHARDFLDAAVTVTALRRRETEPLQVIRNPLDVLAQLIVAMSTEQGFTADSLYAFARRTAAFHALPRRDFDLTLSMLCGAYGASRVRGLEPRVFTDPVTGHISARDGAARLLYFSGGAIPDRGSFILKSAGGARIGELDEEFVWERHVGDHFTLGTQGWKITRITDSEVEVVPAGAMTAMTPFWRGEEEYRGIFYSSRLLSILDLAEKLGPDSAAFTGYLTGEACFTGEAADILCGFLSRQAAATKGLPGSRRVILERFQAGMDGQDRVMTALHTSWGGRLNKPLAMALSAAFRKKTGLGLETQVTDDSILFVTPHQFSAGDIFGLVTADNLDALLRDSLEESGFFGARFRENAGRALMTPRAGFKKRTPLWFNRQRARKIFEAVKKESAFPITMETWRECLEDFFEIDALKEKILDCTAGMISVSAVETLSPSPYCGSLVWKETNQSMYEDDTPHAGGPSALSPDLVREILSGSGLRPAISPLLCRELESRLRLTAPDYAPPPEGLAAHLYDRRFIPMGEWLSLLEACERDHGRKPGGKDLAGVLILTLPCGQAFAALPEQSAMLARALEMPVENVNIRPADGDDWPPGVKKAWEKAIGSDEETALTEILASYLEYRAAVPLPELEALFNLDSLQLAAALEELLDSGAVILDKITEGAASNEVCDAENMERLLRMRRHAARAGMPVLELSSLQLFHASWQRLTKPSTGAEGLRQCLEKLFGLPLPVRLWEEDVFPARLSHYDPAWLDSLFAAGSLQWAGMGREKTAFILEHEAGLFTPDSVQKPLLPKGLEGPFGLFDLTRVTGMSTAQASGLLWKAAWKGEITNTGFEALRKGAMNRFAAFDLEAETRTGARSGLSRWQSSRPLSGHWKRQNWPAMPEEMLDRQELQKERARLLFDRCGVLYREILSEEAPGFGWKDIFPALRIMEMSGEIVQARFFEGIPGVQFAVPAAVRMLKEGLDKNEIWWINAADPVSLCGRDLPGLKENLPRRVASSYCVYLGDQLALAINKNGGELAIYLPPEHPRLAECLAVLTHLVGRAVNPLSVVLTTVINGLDARKSPYAPVLKETGYTGGYKGLELRKKYSIS